MEENNNEELELARARAKAKLRLKQQQEQAPQEEEEANMQAEPTQDTPPTIQEKDKGTGTYTSIRTGTVLPTGTKDESAMGYGMVEGVPFAKDIASGVEALYTSGTQNFGENYRANLDEWNDAINKAEESNPTAFMAGDILSGAALPVKGIKGALAFGSISSASRLEDRDPFAMAEASLEGAALTGGTMAAMKGVGALTRYVGKGLGLLGAETTKEALTGGVSGKLVKKLNRHIRKTGVSGAGQDQNTINFAKRVSQYKSNGEPLLGGFKGQSFSVTAEKAAIARQEVGQSLGKIVREMEEVIPDEVDGKKLFDVARSRLGIDDMLNSPDPDTVQLGKQQLNKLRSKFMDEVIETVPEKVSRPSSIIGKDGNPLMMDEIIETTKSKMQFKKLKITDIQRMKIDHSSTSKKVASGFEKMSIPGRQQALSADEQFNTQITSSLNEVMDELSAKAGKVNPELANAYRNANMQYSDLRLIQDITQEKADNISSGALGMLRKALGMRGLLAANVVSNAGGNAALSMAAAGAINQVIDNPSTGQKMAVSLDKVSKHLTNNPDSPYLKRLVMAAQVANYEPDADGSTLRDAVASIGAEISLMESPIQRTYADIENRSDSILEALQYHSPDQAQQFRDALKSGDQESIRMMMNEASKMPELQNLFAKGKGIDGRVFTEEEKASLRDELDAMDISLNQKLRLDDQLSKQGIIPVVQEEPERFFRPEWRNKDKPRY